VKVPKGWAVVSVSDLISHFDSGVSVNGENYPAADSEYGVLKVSAVTDGVFRPFENKYISGIELQRAAIHPKAHRILMSRANSPELVGASAYLDKDYPFLFLSDKLWQFEPRSNVEFSMRWLAYVLGSSAYRQILSRRATGTSMSMKNIAQDAVLSLELSKPPLPEQNAIAETLSTWDVAIEKLETLIEAKEKSLAGRYQRDFSEEGIRSNGWSRVPLCELFTEVTRSVEGKSLKPYSISAGKGFVSQEEKFGRDISGAQYQNYIHLKPGEFAYNKGNSKRFQQGCIYLLIDDEIAVPNAFISFAPKSDNLVAGFYKHYFLGNRHAQELRKYISSGARGDGLLNVNVDDFFQIKVPIPSIQEQKSLAEAFDIIVSEIELLQQELKLIKSQKRGLMQKLLAGKWRVKG
jgi:type I restriction enzyme, S subunit